MSISHWNFFADFVFTKRNVYNFAVMWASEKSFELT